jgi:hypothetical protein
MVDPFAGDVSFEVAIKQKEPLLVKSRSFCLVEPEAVTNTLLSYTQIDQI